MKKNATKFTFLNSKGFTLIELLIVIAIIAILAAVAYVALDPLTRFKDSRDSQRWHDISELIQGIKLDQVDNKGPYLAEIEALIDGEINMIGTAVAGCDDQNANCDTAVTADTNCIDLTALVTEGYLGEIPVSGNGVGTWDATLTGYTLQKNANGSLTIQACESENTDDIRIAR